MRLTNERLFRFVAGVVLPCSLFFFTECDDFSDDYRARRDSITLGHGNSVAHNIAVQTIDPWPKNVGNTRIHIDGERLLGGRQSGTFVSGVQGYKSNRSIPPQPLRTQEISRERSGN
jgi:hypothetical protein